MVNNESFCRHSMPAISISFRALTKAKDKSEKHLHSSALVFSRGIKQGNKKDQNVKSVPI